MSYRLSKDQDNPNWNFIKTAKVQITVKSILCGQGEDPSELCNDLLEAASFDLNNIDHDEVIEMLIVCPHCGALLKPTPEHRKIIENVFCSGRRHDDVETYCSDICVCEECDSLFKLNF